MKENGLSSRPNLSPIRLDGRLSCAASFARLGAVIADIGTDHGYLPIYLLSSGIAPFAVLSDVNRAPLEKARANAIKYGLVDRMRFVLADGMIGLDPELDGVTDFFICGMGGELIAGIVTGTDQPKKDGVRLILQPMSKADELRSSLGRNGFAIRDEKLCRASGKLYTCLVAEYDGVERRYSPAELLLGPRLIEDRGPLFGEYAEECRRKLRIRADGLREGGLDASREENCLDEIRSLIGG